MNRFFTLRNILIFVVLACMLTFLTYLYQGKLGTYNSTSFVNGLSFSEYSAGPVYDGSVSSVDFDTNQYAVQFRTAIESAMGKGVNFAGHYVLATWGCGTSCESSAIIDARNGAIVVFNLLSEEGVAYTKDSRLLIVNPTKDYPLERLMGRQVATDYYVLDEGNLYLIAKKVNGKVVSNCVERRLLGEQSITSERRTFSSPCKMPFGWFEVIE